MNNMTALVSAFSRFYHSSYKGTKIFDDTVAGVLLSNEEKQNIAASMSGGIKFFCPSFDGNADEALRYIVDNILSPTPLGRAAFAHQSLRCATLTGCRQYVIIASGYDSFACRVPQWANGLKIFEIDMPDILADKQKRIEMAGLSLASEYIGADLSKENISDVLLQNSTYDSGKITFFSMLGISCYLTCEDFMRLLHGIYSCTPDGSSVVFDYMTQSGGYQSALAGGAGEQMKAFYTYAQLEHLLSDCGFLIYESLEQSQIEERFFKKYNDENPEHKIPVPSDAGYILAVKK